MEHNCRNIPSFLVMFPIPQTWISHPVLLSAPAYLMKTSKKLSSDKSVKDVHIWTLANGGPFWTVNGRRMDSGNGSLGEDNVRLTNKKLFNFVESK
ncbi:hypothetical protein OESDEN_18364 [Oesophagostomum dentatum]|uniref:Uncharacterized protein n=1 Tax=Oesophagostomum dentatum TaxID=61180 RepID=A0A0B1SDH1_OESDE|nr:hypothetical protein OESDEN_18364 [Oesophagostomum dentatum]